MSANALVHFDSVHPAVKETIDRISSGENTVPIAACRDYDGNEFMIHVNPTPNPDAPKKKSKEVFDETRTTAEVGKMHISLRHTVKSSILNKFKNLHDTVNWHFDPLSSCCRVLEEPVDDASVITIEIDLGQEKTDAAVAKACELRTICLEAPLCHIFDAFLKNPASVPSIRLPYRAKESMYVFGSKGICVTCVVSIHIANIEDRLFFKSALQSFADVKKHNRAAASAPGFEYATSAPKDIPGDMSLSEPANDASYFWVSFSVSKNQIGKPAQMKKTVKQLVNFRNYIHYHVNCMRSVLHQRMRQRVASSLQVLNRAKTATTGKPRVEIKENTGNSALSRATTSKHVDPTA